MADYIIHHHHLDGVHAVAFLAGYRWPIYAISADDGDGGIDRFTGDGACVYPGAWWVDWQTPR